MRRPLTIACALLAACKSSSKAKPTVEVDDAAPPLGDDAELVDDDAGALDLTDLEITYEETSAIGGTYTIGPEANTFTPASATQQNLVVTNRAGDAVTGVLPPVLYALVPPHYTYPYQDGCVPDEAFVIVTATDPIDLPAGERGVLRPAAVYYLGNSERPQPDDGVGPANHDAYVTRVVPDDDPLRRLALDPPRRAGLAFTIAAGCTPDSFLHDGLIARVPPRDLDDIEAALRRAGVSVTTTLFEDSRAAHAEVVARLTAEIDTYRQTGDLHGLLLQQVSASPDFIQRYAGDNDVGPLVARYVGPDGARAPAADQLLASMQRHLGKATP